MARNRRAALLLLVSVLAASALGVTFGADSGSLSFTKKGHVNCGDTFSVPEGTIEFWFKPTTNNNNEWVISVLKEKDNHMVAGFGQTAFMYMVKTNGQWAYICVSKSEMPIAKWHHLAITFEQDNATIFVDGLKLRKTGAPGHFGLEHLKGGEFIIGKGMGKEYFNGLVSEVRLSDIVRYTEDFMPKKTPLPTDEHTVGLWSFDEKDGTAVRDASGKGRNGVVIHKVGRSSETPLSAGSTTALPCIKVKSPPVIDGKLDDAC